MLVLEEISEDGNPSRTMRINLILQKGGALNREQWHGAAEALSLCRGVDLSFVGFHPPFVKRDLARVKAFGISGILGMLGRPDYAEFIRRLGLPAVSLFGGKPYAGIPQVGTDDRAIGAMAAEHLARPGVVTLAYFGLPDSRSSHARWAGYSGALRLAGIRARRFSRWAKMEVGRTYSPSRIIPWEKEIYTWLEKLPKPAAIFCFDDLRAFWLAGACERMGLRIPDQVALLGAGDDPGYVFACNPHLSSVRIPARQEGFRAAMLLVDLIRGGSPPDMPEFLAPECVVARGSTDILCVPDAHVARALRFIRERRGIGISVEDVVSRGGCCRKVLERLFRHYLGTTILAEIRKEQIEQVRASLRASSTSIEQIAQNCGYTSLNHLARDFKKRTGTAPGAYRRQFHPTRLPA